MPNALSRWVVRSSMLRLAMTVRFVLNGTPVEVDEVDPHLNLLTWLRDRGLTGSKEGCAEGECGACAVALIRRDAQGTAYFQPVNSCLLPVPSVDGERVITVEGVADPSGALHPVQEAMVALGGSQCGYCTPGFVISLFCEYYRPDREGYDPECIAGNLCRCTGYRPIRDAARDMLKPSKADRRLALLEEPVPARAAVDHHTRGQRFVRPTRLPDALQILADDPQAMPIAGGTDLMVYANQRYVRWPTLVSLEALDELQRVSWDDREITLGAGVPLSSLERAMARAHAGVLPLLEQLWPLFSSRLIRNRATIGGSLVTASPIGDLAPALLAYDAELSLQSLRGTRRVPLTQFFMGYRKTVLEPGELVVGVHLAHTQPPLQRFYKVSKRVHDDISTVAAAFALELTAAGHVARLRIAYGGIAATPLRAVAVEQRALGQPWNAATVTALKAELDALGTPMTDHRGSAAYRRAMTGSLLEKFFAETSAAERSS